MKLKYRVTTDWLGKLIYKDYEEEWACAYKDLNIAVSALALVDKDKYIARTFSAMYKSINNPASLDKDYI